MFSFPLLQRLNTRFPVSTLILVVALIPALNVAVELKTLWKLIIIGGIALLLNIWLSYNDFPPTKEKITITLILSLYVIFFIPSIFAISRKITSRKVITADTIKGGISVYFLIGLLWSIFYMMLININPACFSDSSLESLDCIYYSFTTLTTLGYGDIVPVSDFARTLAIMEAFVGQVYLAIFIAQLVGMNIAQKLKESI